MEIQASAVVQAGLSHTVDLLVSLRGLVQAVFDEVSRVGIVR